MSKKLDEIIKRLNIEYDSDTRLPVDYHKTIIEDLNEAYIAGRDETVDYIVDNARADAEEDFYAEGEWRAVIDKDSILAAKTESTLQP